ncbi:MAG: sulfatase-like hydrolase/transferase [Phycisphaeraceae bacterium]|nr:sulfatase-like hydrolase/transferase [Phycisphaeraceae bacterium]
MGKSAVILLALLGVLYAASADAQEKKAPKPNVLIIMADDLGFADLGCYGGDIQTPNLDMLAEDGLRFTQFYTAGRSAASRLSMLTGYYHDQIGASRPAWTKTLPQHLSSAGYRSYHAGKWQLDRWFDEPIQDAGFSRSYHLVDSSRHHWPKEHFLDGRRLGAVERSGDYNASQACTDYMIQFLKDHAEGHKDEPFFAYLAYTSPHHPLQADPDDIADYAEDFDDGWDARRARIFVKQKQMGLIDTDLSPLEPRLVAPGGTAAQRREIGDVEVPYALRWFELTDQQQRFQSEKMRIYAAMVDRMDREIGRIIYQLRRMRAYENTLILFMSDNGASSEILIGPGGHDPDAVPGAGDSYLCLGPGWASSSNTPFRRHKLSTHEGGLTVPMIAHWRRAIEDEGEFKQEVSHLIDVAPTILGLAGVELKDVKDVPTLPGTALTPTLLGEGKFPERELFFNQAGNRALRQGDWKIVASVNDRAWSLYDMKEDRAEKNNVGRGHPEKLLELTMRWERLNKDYEEDAER